jgi:hypothetical protein
MRGIRRFMLREHVRINHHSGVNLSLEVGTEIECL